MTFTNVFIFETALLIFRKLSLFIYMIHRTRNCLDLNSTIKSNNETVEKSVPYNRIIIFNKLPSKVKEVESLKIFRKKLKTFDCHITNFDESWILLPQPSSNGSTNAVQK